MYVRDPARVKLYGPLKPYAAGLCVELGRLGYTPKSSTEVMQLVAHLSRWMQYRDLMPVELTAEVVLRFLADRRKRHRKRLTGRSLLPVLGYLRRVGVVPDEPDPDQDSETGKLVEDYRRYLLHERGLATGSVRRYLLAVRVFLAGVETPLGEGLQRVTAAQVIQFVRDQAGCRSVADAKSIVTALRSLLRFLFMTGKIARPLAMAVPTVANRKLSALPGRLQPGQARLLLEACDRDSVGGRRDYAILLLLMRLGLRAGEVSSIRTGDVDWRAGILSVRGKGGLQDRLPLPPDVGQALVDYLQHGRFNPCAASQLFVARRPPRQGISATTVRVTVARASKRAGLPRIGAHRLRHTLASDLLSAGASLTEIGQVLRHRSQLSTAIYAKVDRTRLAALAQPWPAGAS